MKWMWKGKNYSDQSEASSTQFDWVGLATDSSGALHSLRKMSMQCKFQIFIHILHHLIEIFFHMAFFPCYPKQNSVIQLITVI